MSTRRFQPSAADAQDYSLDLAARWNPALFVAAAAQGIEPERLGGVLRRAGAEPAPVPDIRAQTLPSYLARAFGPGVVELEDGQPVPFAWEKTRELFFYLLHSGPRRREQIIAALKSQEV